MEGGCGAYKGVLETFIGAKRSRVGADRSPLSIVKVKNE